MATAAVLVVTLVQVLTGLAFIAVALELGRRTPRPEDRLAANAFITWWVGLGAYMLLRAALNGYAMVVDPSQVAFLTARILSIPMLVIACWGFVFHTLYVYTGRRGLWSPLAGVFTVIGIAFVYVGVLQPGQTVTVTPWGVDLVPEPPTLPYRIVSGVIGLTIIASTLAYLSLYPRVSEPLQRLRIALVSAGILLWIGSGLVAFWSAGAILRLVAFAGPGLLTAAFVVLAYHPPRTLRDLLDPEQRVRRKREGQYRFAERIGQLI